MDRKGILTPILRTWAQKSTLLLQNRGHAEVLKNIPSSAQYAAPSVPEYTYGVKTLEIKFNRVKPGSHSPELELITGQEQKVIKMDLGVCYTYIWKLIAVWSASGLTKISVVCLTRVWQPFFIFFVTIRSSYPYKLGKPLKSTKSCIDEHTFCPLGVGRRGWRAEDKFVTLFVKNGYGLVSARSQPYHTRPEAEGGGGGELMINPLPSLSQPYHTWHQASRDMAGFSQAPGRTPFLQRG